MENRDPAKILEDILEILDAYGWLREDPPEVVVQNMCENLETLIEVEYD